MEDEQKPESQLPAFIFSFYIGREIHAVFSHWACLLRGTAPFLVLSRFGMKSGAGDSCSFFTLGVVVQGRSPVSCFVQVWHEERGGRFLGL